MNMNPMMLLPLLMNSNNEDGENKMDITKLTSLISAMQGGDPTAILDTIGGENNENVKNMMTLLKTMNMVNTQQKDQSQGNNNTTYNEKSEPDISAVNKFSNNEINQALYNLLKNKNE